ncbi:hypothetical protein [Tuwongella immobilis]|uniref:Uncharacterized protein n=1 Tax=Tuwongella immobilis TaxID=692036 RepID=A0A6C2YTT0_9BACT|nr:hypothetical protein [Tuwongella immobilis]VIP04439.1 unnamed protein product [Tuwongella immobilis]VTS06240.1 unnamed protein product [Tuwongella immobilis]
MTLAVAPEILAQLCADRLAAGAGTVEFEVNDQQEGTKRLIAGKSSPPASVIGETKKGQRLRADAGAVLLWLIRSEQVSVVCSRKGS